jgi:hypothetical protein
MPYQSVDPSKTSAVVFDQVLKTNVLEEVLLPTLLAAVYANRDVALLANGRTETAGILASGHLGQSIAQVVEVALCEELRGHVVLQPQDLGHLHLNAHRAADIAEEVVLGSVDLLGLLDGAVVEPQDDVAVVAVCVVEFGACDALGLAGLFVEDGQRAGCVEADAADGFRVDIVLVHGTLDRVADALPDVGYGLFLEETEKENVSQLVHWMLYSGDLNTHSSRSLAAIGQCSRLPARQCHPSRS